MHTVTFERRDFLPHEGAPGVGWRVQRMAWRAAGGAWRAALEARADEAWRLWGLADLLRCGVRISDGLGLAWWGYVNAVMVQQGAQRVRISLDAMGNKVAVGYRRYSIASDGGERMVTGFQTDADSVRVYGEKERVFQLGQATLSEATAYAKAMLARVRKPTQAGSVHPLADCAAWVDCRGWWETLDWKFAREARGLAGLTRAGKAQPLGNSQAAYRVAQQFTPGAAGWHLGEVWVRVQRVGPALDGLSLWINGPGAGGPGANITGVTVGPEALQEEMGWVRFVLPARVWLNGGATYWILLGRAGATSPSTYYQVAVDELLGYSEGGLYLPSGASWLPRAPEADLCFQAVGEEETTESLGRLLGAEGAGQFLRGVRLEASSGVWARLHRDGSERGRAAAERLLRTGTSAGERLLAEVLPDRIVRVYRQPAADGGAANLVHVRADGRLAAPDGRPLEASQQPAGRWVRLGALAGFSGLQNAIFAEQIAWTPERGVHVEGEEEE
jgi:hypothetical protein